MTRFDEPHWNLAQAAAWVVYRERKLVDDLGNADTDSYAAIRMYPTMRPDHRKQHGKLSALHNALSDGRLKANGYHEDAPDTLAEVPAEAWSDLNLNPPSAYDRRYPGKMYKPWRRIRIKSADMNKLWRGLDEKKDKTQYDWGEVRQLFKQVVTENPKWSTNKKINKTIDLYSERHNGHYPSVTSIKRHMRGWN